jgi:hypothetical protein
LLFTIHHLRFTIPPVKLYTVSLVTVVLVTVVLTYSAAYSQSQTSTLLGLIHDARYQGVGGVQVRLSLANERPNSPAPSQFVFHTVTDSAGRFDFLGLPSGVYSLELSLSGWQSQTIFHLNVPEASTLDVSIMLSPVGPQSPQAGMPASLQQGHSLYLFDRSVCVGRRFGQFSLRELPTTRRVSSILENQDTSVVTESLDIGGLETGTLARFGALGASWTENQYSLNGFDVTDPYIPGRPLSDPDYDGLADIITVTAAKPASFSGSGVSLNLTTQQTSATLHGAIRGFFANGALQSDNMDERLVQFGFPGPERLGHLVDVSAQLSGELSPNRLELPFFISLSTQQLMKTLGGFPAPIDAHVYHALAEFTPFSRGSKHLNLLYAGQHIFNSREGADPGVSPSATLRGNNNFHQFQARWFRSPSESTGLELGFGVAHAIVSAGLQLGTSGTSSVDLPEIFRTGPAPLSFAGTRTRYQSNALLQTIHQGPFGSHSASFGVTLDRSNITNRWDSLGDIEQILVEGAGAEVIRWNTPTQTRQHEENLALFAQDAWRPARWLAVSLGFRLENSSGEVTAASNRISWTTLEPRVGFVIPLPIRGFVLRASFARYGHLLQGRYLDFGNSAALGGQVYEWHDANGDRQVESPEVAQLLRVFGGPYSAIDKNIRRPLTDEFALVLEKQFGQRFVARVSFFRRDARRLVEIFNAGVPPWSYLPTVVIDPGNDGVAGTADDQRLLLFNRQPAALGKDFFVLTNPPGYRASYKGFEIEALKHFSRHWEATGSFAAMHSSAPTNPGNSVFQNDPEYLITDMSIFAALNADPNTLLFATGRSFFDRGFTGKLSGYYQGPHGLEVGAVAKYYDGLPFGRILFVPGFNQGPFFVRATPPADFGAFRTQFNSTLDLRVAQTFALRRGNISFDLDVFNLLNLNKNTLEADLTGPTFEKRVPLAIQSPRTFRVGVEWRF